jgi:tRNA isopentenyl-2-thiomethyl-A-37 hydroxylase MiaE
LIKAVIGRFDSTSQEARRSKMSILRSAAEHLEVLRIDSLVPFTPNLFDDWLAHKFVSSARHFNAFVDLEADYAARRKKISDEIESFQKAGNRATNAVKAIIKTHNQNGLSKKFPTSLFPKPFSAKAHRR